MKKKVYDMIIPLGVKCGASMWLRSLDLQQASYPFDWMTGVDFQTKADLILNDCKGYCELADLEFVPKNPDVPNDAHCDYYKSKTTGVCFVHDFPVGVPLEKSYPAVGAKYQRRVTRLYEDICRAEKVLFFWLTGQEQTPDDVIIRFQREVSKKFGKEIDLLIIEHDPSKENTDKVEKTEPASHILRYRMDTNTYVIITYEIFGHAQTIEPVLKQYALKRPLGKRVWSAVKGPLVRLAALFKTNKEARKAFRRKYFPEYQYRKNLREVHKALKRK